MPKPYLKNNAFGLRFFSPAIHKTTRTWKCSRRRRIFEKTKNQMFICSAGVFWNPQMPHCIWCPDWNESDKLFWSLFYTTDHRRRETRKDGSFLKDLKWSIVHGSLENYCQKCEIICERTCGCNLRFLRQVFTRTMRRNMTFLSPALALQIKNLFNRGQKNQSVKQSVRDLDISYIPLTHFFSSPIEVFTRQGNLIHSESVFFSFWSAISLFSHFEVGSRWPQRSMSLLFSQFADWFLEVCSKSELCHWEVKVWHIEL